MIDRHVTHSPRLCKAFHGAERMISLRRNSFLLRRTLANNDGDNWCALATWKEGTIRHLYSRTNPHPSRGRAGAVAFSVVGAIMHSGLMRSLATMFRGAFDGEFDGRRKQRPHQLTWPERKTALGPLPTTAECCPTQHPGTVRYCGSPS